MIARAVSQIAEWRHRYPQVPPIAINLSPRQFWRPSLAQGMLDALAAADLPTSALEVEITESVVLDPEGDGIEQLNRLRAAGGHLLLDVGDHARVGRRGRRQHGDAPRQFGAQDRKSVV